MRRLSIGHTWDFSSESAMWSEGIVFVVKCVHELCGGGALDSCDG